MEQLTPEGLQLVNTLAERYGFSQEAVIQMMFAMHRGRGAMAQFNHPEFAGSGQWMRGGMLMLGDMFNHGLKARVDGLCQAIAAQLASQPDLLPGAGFPSQSQSGGGQQMQVSGIGLTPGWEGGHGLFAPDPRDTWWPPELGTPSAIGAQNDVRYAFFPAMGRLAVEANGQVTLHDTGGHQIAGLAQQQGPAGAVVFTTPAGHVSLASLAGVGGGAAQQSQLSTGGGVHQQSLSSGGGSQQQQQISSAMPPMTGITPMAGMASLAGMAPMSMAAFDSTEAWWPPELGTPSSTGAQNSLRHAVFPAARRLAVSRNGQVSVHDSGDHQITGCSRAGDGEEVHVSTSAGTIPLSSLPSVGPAPGAPSPPASAAATDATGSSAILEALAKLGDLERMGVLTAEEFATKKAELLSRL
ncbi:MAG: SHOCT domain-containing protein [Cyanobacteriota bacterium]